MENQTIPVGTTEVPASTSVVKENIFASKEFIAIEHMVQVAGYQAASVFIFGLLSADKSFLLKYGWGATAVLLINTLLAGVIKYYKLQKGN